ncbi:MAG: CdvA-like protein [Candidatus Bathyarchaeota archaeon]|nr:MAG: CdvA-like protein [Candidatus Bathyarchaeota archaeon]
MISWKYSFEKVSRELELAKKKKETLDDLLNTGKISQSTYDDLNKSITEAISEIEARQKTLAGKMTAKITELEQQVKTLERFLANTEIEYAAGEVDEELHERESSALTLGLETAKQQLGVIKEAMADLLPGEAELEPSPQPAETIEEVGEETPEVQSEPQTEAPVEAQEEVESGSDEASYEQTTEISTTEEAERAIETLVEETSTEESFPSSEESVEETVTVEVGESSEDQETLEDTETSEMAETEIAVEEAPVEEFSLSQDEEEATVGEEETEE